MLFNLLVDGILDEVVATHMLCQTGHEKGVCYGKKGYGYIRNKITGFNLASQSVPILTLVDQMDTGLSCPPAIINTLLPHRLQSMYLRVVIKEIESWLLADPNIAKYLGVSKNLIPENPEDLHDPKQTLINIARKSRRRRIRDSIVPAYGATAIEGKLYTTELSEYVMSAWDITVARHNSQSLNRCIQCLENI